MDKSDKFNCERRQWWFSPNLLSLQTANNHRTITDVHSMPPDAVAQNR